MALTATKRYNTKEFNFPEGNIPYHEAVYQIAFDNSYAAGPGEAFDFTTVGTDLPAAERFATVHEVLVTPNCAGASAGYHVTYDRVGKVFLVHEEESAAAGGPLPETAGAVDLSSLTVAVLVKGT